MLKKSNIFCIILLVMLGYGCSLDVQNKSKDNQSPAVKNTTSTPVISRFLNESGPSFSVITNPLISLTSGPSRYSSDPAVCVYNNILMLVTSCDMQNTAGTYPMNTTYLYSTTADSLTGTWY